MTHISKADRKKLQPLTRYWERKIERDNWVILIFGAVLGFLLGLIV